MGGCSQGVKQDLVNWGVQPFQLQSANAQINLTDICYNAPNTAASVTFQTQNLPDNFNFNTQIYPITGGIGSSDAVNMLSTPANISPNRAISWGLYHAGAGNFGLTNQYQQYLYLTDNHSTWMGNLVQSNTRYGLQAFKRFVLPGAHDAGMFDSTWINNNLNAFIQSLSKILNQEVPLFGGLISQVLGAIANEYIPRFVQYLAFTQKENVATMLNLGVRYFDFRPGKVSSAVQQYLPQPDSGIYHQHAFIPGYPYVSFLTDVLNWLNGNATEIVVISLSTNGFYDGSMNVSVDELESAWNQAVSNSSSKVVRGGNTDLGSSYDNLISQQKRVIFLNNSNIGNGYYNTTKYDTYDDTNYATFDPSTIVNNVLANMTTGKQTGMDYTVVQIQGTCTAALVSNLESEWSNNKASCIADITSLVTTCTDSKAASFLMSTKVLFDQATYPWVHQNLNNVLLKDQLTVVLNDFADNALADICLSLTSTRMQA